MKIKIALAAAACCFASVGAEATTYVQYTATFSGLRSTYDRSTGTPYFYEKSTTVTINLAADVEGLTSFSYFPGASSNNGIPASVSVNWNANSAITIAGTYMNASENIVINLGNAISGSITNFQSATGNYALLVSGPDAYSDNLNLTALLTKFSDTPFAGPNLTFASPTPEPATWAMMVGGFGLIGAAMRRRQRTSVRFA
jgi:hypothetical protein